MKYIKIFVVYFVILLLLNILGETLIFMTNLNRVRSSLSEVFIYAFFLSLIFTLVITVFEKRKEFTKYILIPLIYTLVSTVLLIITNIYSQMEGMIDVLVTFALITNTFLIVVYEVIILFFDDTSKNYVLYFFLTFGVGLFYFAVQKLGHALYLKLKINFR